MERTRPDVRWAATLIVGLLGPTAVASSITPPATAGRGPGPIRPEPPATRAELAPRPADLWGLATSSAGTGVGAVAPSVSAADLLDPPYGPWPRAELADFDPTEGLLTLAPDPRPDLARTWLGRPSPGPRAEPPDGPSGIRIPEPASILLLLTGLASSLVARYYLRRAMRGTP
jgi:hypothetical protein